MKKFIPLLSVCLFLGAQFSYAQKGFEPKIFNVYSFEQTRKTVSPELNKLSTAADKLHPEYGVLPYNAPCKDCMELIDKRTAASRYYVKKGTNGCGFYIQQYNIPLHFKNAQDQWITVDPRLQPNAQNPKLLEAPNQFCPVSIDLGTGRSTIKSWNLDFNFNENLKLKYVRQDDVMVAVGDAQRSMYTAGSEGVRVSNTWFGIDMEELVQPGKIETNFIVNNKPMFFDQSKWIVIEDKITLPTGFFLMADVTDGFQNDAGFWEGALTVDDDKGQSYISIESPKCRDMNGAIYEGAYKIIRAGNDFTVQIYLDAEWFKSNWRAYPITIDPIVVGTNSDGIYGSYGLPGYNNFGFSGPNPNATCDTSMIVNVPGKSKLVQCYLELEYETVLNSNCGCNPQCGCEFNDVHQRVIGPCDSVLLQCDTSAWQPIPYGTCTTDSNLITGAGPVPEPTLVKCMPFDCSDYSVLFTLKDNQTKCPSGPNGGLCGYGCANGHYWGMTVQGFTDTLFNTTVTYNDSVFCKGDTAKLIANVADSVPVSYLWMPSGEADPVLQTIVNDNSSYILVVTDDCGTVYSDTINLYPVNCSIDTIVDTTNVAPIALQNGIDFYPLQNPFDDHCNFLVVNNSGQASQEISIEVLDVLGQKITSVIVPKGPGLIRCESDMSTFADGLYLARLVVDGKPIKTRRIIKH